jgi:hypothetical protein
MAIVEFSCGLVASSTRFSESVIFRVPYSAHVHVLFVTDKESFIVKLYKCSPLIAESIGYLLKNYDHIFKYYLVM